MSELSRLTNVNYYNGVYYLSFDVFEDIAYVQMPSEGIWSTVADIRKSIAMDPRVKWISTTARGGEPYLTCCYTATDEGVVLEYILRYA